jgi:hypothetical protein
MMATPHMLAGAALGRVLRRPWLAYPAALASHLLLDAVPHIDAHSLFGVERGGPTRMEAAAAVADFAIGAVLVGALAWRARRPTMTIAAFLAIAMDLVEYVPPVGPWFQQWPTAAGFIRFHHAVQHNLTPAQWPLGAATQAAVSALAIGVCLSGGRAKMSPPRRAGRERRPHPCLRSGRTKRQSDGS